MAHDCHINLSVCKEDTGGKTDEPSNAKCNSSSILLRIAHQFGQVQTRVNIHE